MLGRFLLASRLRVFLIQRMQTIFPQTATSHNILLTAIYSIFHHITFRCIIRAYSHQFLLSYHSLLDVLRWVQSLTIFCVPRWYENCAVLAHLVGELRPGAL